MWWFSYVKVAILGENIIGKRKLFLKCTRILGHKIPSACVWAAPQIINKHTKNWILTSKCSNVTNSLHCSPKMLPAYWKQNSHEKQPNKFAAFFQIWTQGFVLCSKFHGPFAEQLSAWKAALTKTQMGIKIFIHERKRNRRDEERKKRGERKKAEEPRNRRNEGRARV